MAMWKELLAEAKERYEPGKGPWSKKEPLDQVDLVFLEHLTHQYAIYSDPKGLLSGCLRRTIEEVRAARGWPTPPGEDMPYNS